jgi:hypothetical protein
MTGVKQKKKSKAKQSKARGHHIIDVQLKETEERPLRTVCNNNHPHGGE